MSTALPLRRGARERLVALHGLLEGHYGTPEATLGNKRDPLDEAIYIILTFQTDIARAASSWSLLKAAYPSWDELHRAPARRIAVVLREGGLQRQKTQRIKLLLAALKRSTGSLSLDFLRGMDTEFAERSLLRLPGLSWKGARCVLLYSLDREVFPVDSNAFRVLYRAGVLGGTPVYRRRSLHDALQDAVPPELRRALHVNLVVHGQRTCLPRSPRCTGCELSRICPRVGLREVPRGAQQVQSGATRRSHRKRRRVDEQGADWDPGSKG